MADNILLYQDQSQMESDSRITLSSPKKYARAMSNYEDEQTQYTVHRTTIKFAEFIKDETTGFYWLNGDTAGVKWEGNGIYVIDDRYINEEHGGKYELHEMVTIGGRQVYRATGPSGNTYYASPSPWVNPEDGRVYSYDIYNLTGEDYLEWICTGYILEAWDVDIAIEQPTPTVACTYQDGKVYYNSINAASERYVFTEESYGVSWESFGMTEGIYLDLLNKATSPTLPTSDIGIWFKMHDYATNQAPATEVTIEKTEVDGNVADCSLTFERPGIRGFDSYGFKLTWKQYGSTTVDDKKVWVNYNSGIA